MAAILITDYLFTHLLFSVWCTGRQQLQQRFYQLLKQIWTNFPGKCCNISTHNLPVALICYFSYTKVRVSLTSVDSLSQRISEKKEKPPVLKEMEKLERPPLPLQSQITKAPLVTVHPPQLIFNRGEATLSPSCLFHISGVTPSLSLSPSPQLSLTHT